MSAMRDKRRLQESSQARESLVARAVWKATLKRYGPKGEGPMSGASMTPDAAALCRAVKALIALGPGHGLPAGTDPERAVFIAGKELASVISREFFVASSLIGGLDVLSVSTLSEAGFERAEAFVEGARAAMGEECLGQCFAQWLCDVARAGQADRLDRLLRAGISANAMGETAPLQAAFEGDSRACVDTLLRHGADLLRWQEPCMGETGFLGMSCFHFGRNFFAEKPEQEPREGLAARTPRDCPKLAAWREARGQQSTEAGWLALANRRDGAVKAKAEAWIVENHLVSPETGLGPKRRL